MPHLVRVHCYQVLKNINIKIKLKLLEKFIFLPTNPVTKNYAFLNIF
jgi:hypothetical protein